MTSLQRVCIAFGILMLASTPSWVAADMAPPPITELDCPRGAVPTLPTITPGATDPRGRPARPWPYCAPSTCASDAECADGRICSSDEVSFCVESSDVEGGGTVRTIRDRGCEPDGTCLNIHSTCETSRRCVAAEAPAAEASAAEAPAAPEVPAVEPTPAPVEPAPAEPASGASTPAAAESTASGCACHAAGRGGSGWLALLPFALLILRRRRSATS